MGTIARVMDGYDEPALSTAAGAVADLLDLTTSDVELTPGAPRARLRELVDTTDRGEVAVVALSAQDPLIWEALALVRKPMLVVPHSGAPDAQVHRVLVPLDGDPRTSATVSDIVARAAAAGAWTCVLHVFDEHTTPAFWDQAAHTRPAWTEEFRRRNLPVGDEVDLRRGDPSEQVLDAACTDDVDLIVIGWRRHLDGGHARVVRRLVAEAPAPVLLLEAVSHEDPGP